MHAGLIRHRVAAAGMRSRVRVSAPSRRARLRAKADSGRPKRGSWEPAVTSFGSERCGADLTISEDRLQELPAAVAGPGGPVESPSGQWRASSRAAPLGVVRLSSASSQSSSRSEQSVLPAVLQEFRVADQQGGTPVVQAAFDGRDHRPVRRQLLNSCDGERCVRCANRRLRRVFGRIDRPGDRVRTARDQRRTTERSRIARERLA